MLYSQKRHDGAARAVAGKLEKAHSRAQAVAEIAGVPFARIADDDALSRQVHQKFLGLHEEILGQATVTSSRDLKHRCVQLAFAGIQDGGHGAVGHFSRVRQCFECGNGAEGFAGGPGKRLGNGQPNAQAGKRTRPMRNDDPIQFVWRARGLVKNGFDQGKHDGCVVPSRLKTFFGNLPLAVDDPYAGAPCGGVDTQNTQFLPPAMNDARDVIVEGKRHQTEEKHETDLLRDFAVFGVQRPAAHRLDEEKQEMPAVQNRNR